MGNIVENLKFIYLLFLISSVICRRIHPRTTQQPATKPIFIAREVLDYGHKFLNKLRILHPEFCKTVSLQSETKYKVVPWWYNYCKEAKLKADAENGEVRHYFPMHANILKQIHAMKKKHILREHVMRKYAH